MDETRLLKKGGEVRRGAAPVQRHGGSVRELPDCRISWPMPVAKAGRYWTGSCTCPRCGQRTGSESPGGRGAGGCDIPDQAATGATDAGAGCWSREFPSPGLPGDEVYSSDGKLRLWLEGQEIPHVMAVKSNEKLWGFDGQGTVTGEGGLGWRPSLTEPNLGADAAPGMAPRDLGSTTGPPWKYGPSKEPGKGHWLLARRSTAKPGELAYYVCFGPAGTTLGGTGEGGWDPVGNRRVLQGGQGRGGVGPVQGAAVGWLVPAHHAGYVGPSLSDGNQASSDGRGRKGSPLRSR